MITLLAEKEYLILPDNEPCRSQNASFDAKLSIQVMNSIGWMSLIAARTAWTGVIKLSVEPIDWEAEKFDFEHYGVEVRCNVRKRICL